MQHMSKFCVIFSQSLLSHSVEKAKEFFSKEWFSGLPYSASKLEGECLRVAPSSVTATQSPISPRLSLGPYNGNVTLFLRSMSF